MARVIPSIRRIVRWPLSSPREVLQSLLYRSLCHRWWSSDRQLPESGQSSRPLLHYLYLCLSLVGDWIYLFESHLCEIFVVSVLIEKFFRLLDFESCTYLLAGIQLLSTIGRSYWKKHTSIWRRILVKAWKLFTHDNFEASTHRAWGSQLRGGLTGPQSGASVPSGSSGPCSPPCRTPSPRSGWSRRSSCCYLKFRILI